MMFNFHFGKKDLALALFHGFCSPKITTPREQRPPESNEPQRLLFYESNEGRYYRNFSVRSLEAEM